MKEKDTIDRIMLCSGSSSSQVFTGCNVIGMFILQRCCPPPNTIDPIIKQHAKRSLVAFKVGPHLVVDWLNKYTRFHENELFESFRILRASTKLNLC